MALARGVADQVARHLVAAGTIIDEDSELALQHAIAARRLASRIAVVREAVGLAAYAAGDWTTAIAELRTYHRMTGRQTHLAELADCERALGRPERAIDLFRGADMATLEKANAIELLIVAAGARGDLGQHDAAVAMLQVRELTSEEDAEWAARLRYAYADSLLAADRRDEAREWFARAAAVDEEQLTDAAERLLELDGVSIEGDDLEDEDDEETEVDGAGDGPRAEADSAADADDADDLDDEFDEDERDEDEQDDVQGDDQDEQDGDEDRLAGTDVNTDPLEGEAPGSREPVAVATGGVTDSLEKPAADDESADRAGVTDSVGEREIAAPAGNAAPASAGGVTDSLEKPAAGAEPAGTGGVTDSLEKPGDEFTGRAGDERPQG
ncbi:Replicase polyprotein 1ab [Actinoplanes sp. NBC_00393]|uniref:tetratricopeptide repeat protein n=1 Tax=Actinoplanes sp. NBC_00393 TaxID=2975953 RepID=UPI002E1BA5DE